MIFEELKEKANSLPYVPGVYIMRDKTNTVIYVGKAKKLRNRVSQYFQDTVTHSPKTKLMVSKIHQFDVIIAASEFEALVLECSLIKRYMPKYNILLKDDKGYPYVRIDFREAYPQLDVVSKIANDGAEYYGPFGSRAVTMALVESIRLTLKLPSCSKRFPRDIGKGRPCLNYHMNQCHGWCQAGTTQRPDYGQVMEQARQLLTGNFKKVTEQLRQEMLAAAGDLNFELAAGLRDRLKAVEALGQKQLVTAGKLADTDVIGFAQTETTACFTVLHYSGGNLLDKTYELLPRVEDPEGAVSSLLKQYYLARGFAPRIILLPFPLDDAELFGQMLEQNYGRKCKLHVPQRGDNVHLVDLARKNALEEAQRVTGKEERALGALNLLSKMLSVPTLHRIESFDISNTAGSDIVASMVVYRDGRPYKSDYKRFQIRDLENQDDYASMYQVITRRYRHYLDGDSGFDVPADLLLIDGGIQHAATAVSALQALGISIPVFGMVKDDRHRTRALVTPDGAEIAIDTQPAIFALIGNIQEETHRFAISYHRKLQSKRLRYSELDKIPGIGPKRKQELLKVFKSISAIRSASLAELERFLPRDAASAVYEHFHSVEKGEGNL